jgi:pimeloyl-ACP methyl ester carboxylesterase
MCPTIWAICKAPSPRAPAEPFKDLPRIFQAPSARLLSNTPSVKENTMRRRSLAHLRPVRDVDTPSLQFRTIHGYRRAFRVAGSGPALLLIHGVGDSSTTWETVHAKLAQRFTVIAPDLLGHGESDKPRADYSLAAFANGMRDLLSVLGIDRVTVVGHSLGGGIAMQFAYQYPQFVERIVLVSSGGVTKDVSFALRLAALPMGSEALAMLRVPGALPAVQLAGRAAGKILGSTKFGRDLPDGLRLFARLREPAALSRTLRAVVDGRGQLVTMLDRSYLMQCMPLQLIWGEDDLVIPVSHARIAHAAVPGSRLEIFKHSGHMPFHDHPDRFVEIVERFVDSTEPAEYDRDLLRSLLLGICQTGPGSVDPASRGA